MTKPLVKHPNETDTYAIGHGRNMADGEVLGSAVVSPMLLLGSIGPGSVTVAVTRVDAQAIGAGDLVASGAFALGSQVLFALSGGNDGVVYQIEDTVASSAGATKVGQGQMLVTTKLPQP